MPDPWTPPDWAYVHSDDEERNRYDDPERYYRVLYAASDRFACFLETLARFRPNMALLADLQSIDGDDDFVPVGTVPAAWLAARCIGSARLYGEYVDVLHSGSVAVLRQRLAKACLEFGLTELDTAALRLSAPRRFTQIVSRTLYNAGAYAGIRYASKLGDDLELWAIFEPFAFEIMTSTSLQVDDADLRRALYVQNLQLV